MRHPVPDRHREDSREAELPILVERRPFDLEAVDRIRTIEDDDRSLRLAASSITYAIVVM